MTTYVPTLDMTGSRVEPRTRAGLVSLVGGALLVAAGRILATPGGSPGDRLDQMTHHDGQVTVSALLAIAGFAALVPGFATVAAEVRGRGAALATLGCGLVVVGAVGFAVLASVDLVTLATTHVGDRASAAAVLHRLDVSPGILVLTPFAVAGYFFGPFLVSLGARRAGFVPRWLPWGVLASLVLQPVGVGLGGPALARVVDSVCQLVLVVMVVLLTRYTTEQHLRSA